MNKWIPIGAIALLLIIGIAVYFGTAGDAPDQPTTDTAPAVTDDDTEAAPGEADETTDTEDETQVVVEESAAEPDDEEQPIVLARADREAATADWQFTEGRHYERMVPSQPTVGGADKIEVAEFFSYGCPHCYTFEPTIKAWASDIPGNARFVRVPVAWNQLYALYARLFYTKEVLARNGTLQNEDQFHDAVFAEIHQRGNRLASEDSIRRLFDRYGVSNEAFDRTWRSFEVDQKLRVASDLTRRYAVSGVPAIVVNGKYRTGAADAGGYPALIDVIDELILRESQH